MRRPFSIMRSDPHIGTIDILYKIVGQGSAALATRKAGDTIQCLGPIGNAFILSNRTTHPLLLGGGVGIPPMIFFADELRKNSSLTPFVMMGSEIPFPFTTKPSKILVPNIPSDVIAAMPLLDDWGVASRLTSQQGYQGCFEGYVHQLAEHWFKNLDHKIQHGVEVFACGPTKMLKAVAEFAKRNQLPCQVSLEEHMACAVGGCAGCVVPYKENNKVTAMKRVCVDGPIFSAENVY
jgi:dihydroorotate dehydrogenase electron transfer subunit